MRSLNGLFGRSPFEPLIEHARKVHECVALHAALGNSMVTGKPAATAVHVDVGLLNYGTAIHTAWKGNYPVLITSGTGPRAFPESMPGARDRHIQ